MTLTIRSLNPDLPGEHLLQALVIIMSFNSHMYITLRPPLRSDSFHFLQVYRALFYTGYPYQVFWFHSKCQAPRSVSYLYLLAQWDYHESPTVYGTLHAQHNCICVSHAGIASMHYPNCSFQLNHYEGSKKFSSSIYLILDIPWFHEPLSWSLPQSLSSIDTQMFSPQVMPQLKTPIPLLLFLAVYRKGM